VRAEIEALRAEYIIEIKKLQAELPHGKRWQQRAWSSTIGQRSRLSAP